MTASGSIARQPLRVLLVEDAEFDAQLVAGLLRAGGYEVTAQRVDSPATLSEALRQRWDVVIADHQMPALNAAEALRLVQASGQDLPFIITSDGISDEEAVALMKAGAHDFLLKGRLHRLVAVVEREVREARNRAERRAGDLRLSRLWDSSPDAILMMDAQGRIAFANPAARAMFGLPEQELIGLPFERLARPADPASDFPSGPETEEGTRLMEMTGRGADGKELFLEVAFSELTMPEQQFHIAFLRDITARRLAERALRAAEKEFGLARDIQQRLFPRRAPRLAGWDLAGRSYPAVQTGGDYYDYLTMPEGDLGLVVSDVSGHGMGPALIMAETRAYLRIAAHNRRDAGMVLTRANSVLAEDLEDGAQFVTALLLRLNPAQRTLWYANAGHTAGYVLDGEGRLRGKLDQRGPPLGILPDSEYRESAPLTLNPGDLVLLLTDGIEETEDPLGRIWGIEPVLEIVRTNRHRAAAEILNAVRQAARDFSAGQPQRDDWTMMVIKAL